MLQVTILNIATAAEDGTDALASSFTYNGTTVTAAQVAKNASAAVQATAFSDAINGYAGSNIATVVGTAVHVVSDATISLAGFKSVSAVDAAAASTTAVVLAFGGGVYVSIGATECMPRAYEAAKTVNLRFMSVLSFIVGAAAIGLVLLDHEHCERN